MQELTLPELRPTKRVKANPKKGLPERISIDPRTRDAHSSNRRFQRGFNAIDQNLLPLLGPFPVIPQQDITQVDISGTTSDEERNMAAHLQNWSGREIPNPPEDTAKLLVNILNFLMPPPNLGDMPGDATRYDKKGNLIIVKEEPKTSSSEDELGIINDSTQETRNTGGCNCRCHTTPNANEGGGDNNPVPEIYGDGEPIPSTTTGITHAPEITKQSNLSIPGHLEISGEALANMFNEFFKEMDVSITPKKANIAGKWIFDSRVNRTQMVTDQGPVTSDQDQVLERVPNQDLTHIGGKPNPNDPEEPKVPVSSDPVPASTDPAQVKLPGNTTMEDIIQILDDHIARSENVSENTEKPPLETDPLEELLALEQEEQESESDLEDEGIVNVVDTSDSNNDEVIVNPVELEAGPEMRERMGDNCPQENNNNQDEQKILYRDPVPQKTAPNCNEEHRQAPPPPPPNRNWWDDPEEDEEEKRSEDDISTDKQEENDSSQ